VPLQFKGKEVAPTDQVKLLGVTLDKEVRFKVHLADKAGKATKTALALRRLKGLQPKTVKQLVMSAVLPVADYASLIWYPIATQDMKWLLQQPQRITAQAVIRGFRTVALSVAEVEAGLVPLEQRLRKQRVLGVYSQAGPVAPPLDDQAAQALQTAPVAAPPDNGDMYVLV
jgi:hypothetical protein